MNYNWILEKFLYTQVLNIIIPLEQEKYKIVYIINCRLQKSRPDNNPSAAIKILQTTYIFLDTSKVHLIIRIKYQFVLSDSRFHKRKYNIYFGSPWTIKLSL